MAVFKYKDSNGKWRTLPMVGGGNAISTTYAELRELKRAGKLAAGRRYRITDYECITTQTNTQSAGHSFDIIVTALDGYTFAEDAQAIQHDGDTYFVNNNLAAWELKYDFDNNTTRYAWGKKWVEERAQSWTTQWGVLESKNNADNSTNYATAVVNGVTKYLYAPAERGTYLDSKTFYRNILVDSISYDDLIFEADSAPYEQEFEDDLGEMFSGWNWSDVSEIRVKTADGKLVTKLYRYADYDYDNYFLDENDSDEMYLVHFSPNYTEVDGVYHFTPESGSEEWWDNVYDGAINTYEKQYYTGSKSALYYCFDTILPKMSITVTEVYSTETQEVYKAEDTLDTVVYQPYVAPAEGGKGVIYRMVDEFGNDAPFDFKNIQHEYEGNAYYTFGVGNIDYSLNKACANNVITSLYGNRIMRTIFEVVGSNYQLRNNLLDVEVSDAFYLCANRCEDNVWRKSEQLNASASNYGKFTYNTAKNITRVCRGNKFFGVVFSLDIVENHRDCIYYLSGYDNSVRKVSITQSQRQCVSNIYDFRDTMSATAKSIVVTGSGCQFSTLRILGGTFTNNMVMSRAVIEASNTLTLSSKNTTSTNFAISNLKVNALNWTSAENITIENFQTNAPYTLNVAKDSKGEIEMWCDADTEDSASTEQQPMWIKAEGEAGVRLKGTNGTATGNLAISAGDDKIASDGTPFASVASGDHAVAFGYGNTSAGRTTLTQGLYNIVNGKDSVAFGQRNLVNGDQAFAAGQQNEVIARLGVAIGYENKATNTDSIAIGYQNISGGSAAVAMGDTCEANGTSSVAMGYKTKATSAYSSTFGENTQATNEGEVAMGKYNKSTTSTDASEQTLFSFGVGTSDTNRANALEIKKNGDVYLGEKKLSDFVTSQYVDEVITRAITTTLNTEV